MHNKRWCTSLRVKCARQLCRLLNVHSAGSLSSASFMCAGEDGCGGSGRWIRGYVYGAWCAGTDSVSLDSACSMYLLVYVILFLGPTSSLSASFHGVIVLARSFSKITSLGKIGSSVHVDCLPFILWFSFWVLCTSRLQCIKIAVSSRFQCIHIAVSSRLQCIQKDSFRSAVLVLGADISQFDRPQCIMSVLLSSCGPSAWCSTIWSFPAHFDCFLILLVVLLLCAVSSQCDRSQWILTVFTLSLFKIPSLNEFTDV